jgi:type IV pilus assembly protein PilE
MTLLELMVVVALAGILSALAYPSYRAYLLRAHRVEAIDALLTVAAAQEQFHIRYGRYAGHFEANAESAEPGLNIVPLSPGGRYRLALGDLGPADFAVTAVPAAGAGQDADERCSRFTLRANGQRGATDAGGNDNTRACWGQT